MRRAIDWAFGILCLLIGISLGGWIAYNFLVEMQPEARGKNPLPAVLVTALSLYVGVTRIRRGMRRSVGNDPA